MRVSHLGAQRRLSLVAMLVCLGFGPQGPPVKAVQLGNPGGGRLGQGRCPRKPALADPVNVLFRKFGHLGKDIGKV